MTATNFRRYTLPTAAVSAVVATMINLVTADGFIQGGVSWLLIALALGAVMLQASLAAARRRSVILIRLLKRSAARALLGFPGPSCQDART